MSGRHWRRSLLTLGAVALLGLLAACAGEEATPTPTATATATLAPGQTPVTATATPTATTAPVQVGQYGGTMRWATRTPYVEVTGGSIVNRGFFGPIVGQMVRYDPEGTSVTAIIGDLAESWEVLDGGLTYVFHLRDDAFWHDGTPVTSADVLASWQWVRQYAGAAGNWRIAFDRDEAPDPHTAIIRLTDTVPDVLPYMSTQVHGGSSYLFQKAQLDTVNGDAALIRPQDLIGFGAFKIKSADPAAGLVGERVDNYWQFDEAGNRLPYLSSFHAFGIVDASTRNAALLGGQLDAILSVSFEAKDVQEMARSQPRIKSQAAGFRGWYVQVKNVAPFDDYKVRKAIHLAMDRWTNGAIIEVNHPATRVSGWSPLALTLEELSVMPGYRQDKTEDWAEANRLLDEAGYPRGANGVRFTIPAFQVTTQFYIDGHTLYLEDLKVELGINYTLDIPPDSTVQANRSTACDYVFYSRARANDDPSPAATVGEAMLPLPGTGHEACGWSAPQYLKDMALEMMTTVDQVARLQLAKELELAYYEDQEIGYFYIVLHNGPYINGYWDYVKGSFDRPWYNRSAFIGLQETWLER